MELSKQENKITWRKVRGHLKTINEHKMLVMRHCFRIGLYRQGLLHDLSKYMPSELLMGFRYYDDGKSSPNNGERRDKGYSNAWMHHKGRNKHHFEYWSDYSLHPSDGKYPLQAVQMPRKYVAEMLMDRISASKNYNKDTYTQHHPLQYFERGKSHYLLHPQTEKELHGMLRILDQCGEERLMYFVKEYYLKGYKI
ncbi:MAG: DUF5662 family protein [Lachnospiraceae bacterium]|nr:DUF5662 family protein [Lachnospiraceae bacterium]